jgi:hypothetical protein
MCFSETFGKVYVGKNVPVSYSEWFETRCFITVVSTSFWCHWERSGNQKGLKLNGTHQVLVCAQVQVFVCLATGP